MHNKSHMDCAGDNNGMTFQKVQDYRNTLEKDRVSEIIFLVYTLIIHWMRFQDLLMYLAITFMQQLSFVHSMNHVENDWSLSQIALFIFQLVALIFSRCIYSTSLQALKGL